MRRSIPSTRALLVFDTVPRHANLSRAAEALNLTHSAVSQQLRHLETLLGQALFQRGSRGVTLTAAGERYRASVVDTLQRLEDHTLDVMAMGQGESSLLLGVVPVIGERWLMPRLQSFAAQHPKVQLQVQVFPTNHPVPDPRFDLAIHYQRTVWPQASMQALMAEECLAVGSPQLTRLTALQAGDFSRVPLLHLASRPHAWTDWLVLSGAQGPINPLAGHRFDLFSMLVEAARAAMGVGLVPRFCVQRELEEGSLVQLHPMPLRDDQAYGLFIPAHRSQSTAVRACAQWLHACCQAA